MSITRNKDMFTVESVQFIYLAEVEKLIKEFEAGGNKINAIKKVREAYRCGLREAKEMVEAAWSPRAFTYEEYRRFVKNLPLALRHLLEVFDLAFESRNTTAYKELEKRVSANVVGEYAQKVGCVDCKVLNNAVRTGRRYQEVVECDDQG